MKHYKDAQGNVYAYAADGSQDQVIKSGLTLIEDHEVQPLIDASIQADFDSLDWYRKRIYSYPDMGDFIDAYVKGDQTAIEEYRQKCLAVKAKYPKPPGF